MQRYPAGMDWLDVGPLVCGWSGDAFAYYHIRTFARHFKALQGSVRERAGIDTVDFFP